MLRSYFLLQTYSSLQIFISCLPCSLWFYDELKKKAINFKVFFFMCATFRVFIEFITILLPAYALVLLLLLSLFLMLWCFRLQGILALSSLTRNWTSTPGTGRGSLNPWAPREVPASCNFKYSLDSRGILSALGLLLSTRFLCLGLGYACRRNTIKVSSLNIFPFSPNTEVQQKYGYFRWSVFSFQIRAKIGLA